MSQGCMNTLNFEWKVIMISYTYPVRFHYTQIQVSENWPANSHPSTRKVGPYPIASVLVLHCLSMVRENNKFRHCVKGFKSIQDTATEKQINHDLSDPPKKRYFSTFNCEIYAFWIRGHL